VKDFFRITCYILIAAGLCTLAATEVARLFEAETFREMVRIQHEDETVKVGLAVEKALTSFAIDAGCRMGQPLEYTLDRVPVSGQAGAFIYTIKFIDREYVREARR
jgi:hypothetical protein